VSGETAGDEPLETTGYKPLDLGAPGCAVVQKWRKFADQDFRLESTKNEKKGRRAHPVLVCHILLKVLAFAWDGRCGHAVKARLWLWLETFAPRVTEIPRRAHTHLIALPHPIGATR